MPSWELDKTDAFQSKDREGDVETDKQRDTKQICSLCCQSICLCKVILLFVVQARGEQLGLSMTHKNNVREETRPCDQDTLQNCIESQRFPPEIYDL